MNLPQWLTLLGPIGGVGAILIAWFKARPEAENIVVRSGERQVISLNRVITALESEIARLNVKLNLIESDNDRKAAALVERDKKIDRLLETLDECQSALRARTDRLRNDVEDIKEKNGLTGKT
jgi:chromosome segregation ATPase